MRKMGITLHTPVLLYKSGVEGVKISRTCYPDAFFCLALVSLVPPMQKGSHLKLKVVL